MRLTYIARLYKKGCVQLQAASYAVFIFLFFFLVYCLNCLRVQIDLQHHVQWTCCHFWPFMSVPNFMLRTAAFNLLSFQFLFVAFFLLLFVFYLSAGAN